CPCASVHARRCPEDDLAGPVPNRFLTLPTRPTSGSSPAALADWQRGRAVIAADRFGQAVALKDPLKTFAHRFTPGIFYRTHLQEVNGYIHRAPLRAHSVGRRFSTSP